MPKALVADVCVSELGWELMAWNGHVRYLSQAADYTLACSTAALAYLYADFCHDFIPHKIKGVRDCHKMKKVDTLDEMARASNDVDDRVEELAASGYQVIRIKPEGWERWPTQQAYVRFGDLRRAVALDHQYDVVIHARARTNKTEFTGSNYPARLWQQVVTALAHKGLRVCCIGTKDQALELPLTEDMRDIAVARLVDLLAAAGVVVGPSSGPMHLASLCGAPHVVWSHTNKAPSMGCTNEMRYRKVWNPFGTPVRFMPTLEPKPDDVVKAVEEMLSASIRER